MNYHELKERATPGPLTLNGAQLSLDLHDNALDGTWFTKQELANAQLIAHCVNKFDKALEALAVISDEARGMLEDTPEVLGLLHTAAETVAELETVED